jgi:transcriptional regulator with XRE-family HTH domain
MAIGNMVTIARDLCPWVKALQGAHSGHMHTTRPTSPKHIAPTVSAQDEAGLHVGDLARRVTHRRTELGLTTEELAHRAGVDAWFLAYFEQSSDTSLSGGALLRLAVAMDTTPLALEGGLVSRPPGEGRAAGHPSLEALSSDACAAHLAPGGLGRIVLSTSSGPVAFPVNFVFSDGNVIFRTTEAMAQSISGIVAFEVDHIDEAMSGGWSVLVRGHARQFVDPAQRQAAARLDIEPWAGGARLNLIVISPYEITGRVIVQHSMP